MAAKFLMNGGVTNDWSDDTNWSLTSSAGPNNTTHAVAGDTVTIDAGSPACVVNTNSACASVNCTGYTNTLTYNADLTLTGGMTYSATMTIAGTAGTLIFTASAAFASASLTHTAKLQIAGASGTTTLTTTGNPTINGLFTMCQVSGANALMNGGSWTLAGGILVNASNTGGGTATLTLTGGTWSQASAGFLKTSLTLAGNITISGSVHFSQATLTYSSGTITVTGSTLVIDNVSTTLSLGSGCHLNNYTCPAGSVTVTLSAALFIDGTGLFNSVHTMTGAFAVTIGTLTYSSNCTLGATTTVTVTGTTTISGTCTLFAGGGTVTLVSVTLSSATVTITASNVTASGTTTVSGASSISGAFNYTTAGLTTTNNLTGTSTIVFGGTGTWTGAAGSVANNVTINTPGTLTLSGTILYTTGTITYTTGTVSAGTSILSIASGTMNTSGMSWANVKPTGTALTLGSAIVVTDTLTFPNSAFTWSGAFNITVGTLTNVTYTATRIVTFVSGTTVTINNAFTTVGGTSTIRFTWKASIPGTTTAFNLSLSATQSVAYVDPTDLDASAGSTIYTYQGVVTNSLNWTGTLTGTSFSNKQTSSAWLR